MKIKKILSQTRRDFQAVFECEHCGFEHEQGGYDDANFHGNIIPDMECPSCGEKAPSEYRPLSTRYAEHEVV